MSKENCTFCGRKGVLIYPVRYAVACPAGAAPVPPLSGNFRIDAGAPAQIAPAKYTLRALRAGYLYTYDEKRRRLKAYLVLPMGYLRNFPVEYPPPDPASLPFSCVDPGDIAPAHCVDILHSKADPAGNLWIGWSSVAWTRALLDKVGQAAWRQQHMRCLDVAAMLAGSAAHSGAFDPGYRQVAHFALDKAAMQKAFGFSNTPVADEADQHGWAPDMVRLMAAQAPWHRGFIAAVNDPVGITNDLSELTLPSLDAGFDERMYRGKMIADLLSATRDHVRGQARADVVSDDHQAELMRGSEDGDTLGALKMGWQAFKAGGMKNYQDGLDKDKRQYGTELAGRQDAAADHAWDDLTHEGGSPLLDQARLDAFPQTYQQALDAYEPVHHRLLQAHRDWLTSTQLAQWMAAVHDSTDIRSGYAYSETLGQCLGKAVAGAMCTVQLDAWLGSGKLRDTGNLYGRALLFNQDALVAAAESQVKTGDVQFESVFNIYKEALDRLDRHDAAQLFDRLALVTANVLVRALKHGTRTPMRALAIAHLWLLGGVAIKAGNATPAQLAKWIIGQTRERGVALASNSRKTQTAAYREAKRAIASRAADDSIVFYEIDIDKIARDGRIEAGALKEVKIPGVDLTRQWLGSSVPHEFHLGMATTIIQMVALNFAARDLADNDRFNQADTRIKLAIAIASLGSTIVDTVGTLVEKQATHPLAKYLYTQWGLHADRAAKYAKYARGAALITGICAGLYDILISAMQAESDKQYTLAKLYRINGAVGAATALAAFFEATLFWPGFVATILLGIALAIFKDGELKVWISRCYFSLNHTKNDNDNSYLGLDEELKAYQHSMGE